MAVQSAFTTPYQPQPYITVAEFQNAPTALDTYNLVVGGTAGAENTELFNVIMRASSWIDEICQTPLSLAATVNVEATRGRANRRGELVVHPKGSPILEVRDFEYGATPNQLYGLADLTNLWIEPQLLTARLTGGFTTSSGPMQFASWRPGTDMFVRFTYVNGWANTTLSALANQGDTAVTVKDATGIYGGSVTTLAASSASPASHLTIYDGVNTERNLIVTNVTGNVLTLSAPLANAHASGIAISALPDAVKFACVLLTAALIKTRGDRSLVMQSISSPPDKETSGHGSAKLNDYDVACDLLRAYMRVR